MSDDVSIRTPTYRAPRPRGTDPTTRRLALTAAGLGAALLTVVGAWSLTGHHTGGGPVPVIAPPAGPMRVKPADPGGMQVPPMADLYAAKNGTGQPGQLAPPPEEPDPAALRASARHPPAPTPALAAANEKPAATMSAAAEKPTAPATPSPAPARPAPAIAGGAQVQLAALQTEQAAKEEWAVLRRRLPDLLGDRQPALSRAEVGGHAWWRVRTGGFPDSAAAKQFCERVRAKGAACDVARF